MNTDKRRIQEEENHSIADDSSNSTVEGKKFEEILTLVEKLPKKTASMIFGVKIQTFQACC